MRTLFFVALMAVGLSFSNSVSAASNLYAVPTLTLNHEETDPELIERILRQVSMEEEDWNYDDLCVLREQGKLQIEKQPHCYVVLLDRMTEGVDIISIIDDF